MKTKNAKVILSAVIVLALAWAFASCSKKDDNPVTPTDKTGLKTALDSANHYLSTTTEGTLPGQYSAGAKTALQTATTTAQTIYDAAGSTQSALNGAATSLTSAISTYKGLIILEVGVADLVAFWKFDEGTGTTVADASGNGHDGTLMDAIALLGGTKPTWVADRKNAANKALHFTTGGHVEVPASAALVPAEISISVWVKLDSMNTATGHYADNEILAQNAYHVYKFQTQEAAKPFLTVASTNGNFLNEDTGDGAPADPGPYVASTLFTKKWYHLAVTFSNGTFNFYINGLLARTVTDAAGTIAMPAALDKFCIGMEEPNEYYTTTPDYTPPHFEGSIDQVRIYKKVLSITQIASIYNEEK